jgi:hypothetical protein
MSSPWYVKGISLAILINLLTNFQVALLENVSITLALQRPTSLLPPGHRNHLVALNHSFAYCRLGRIFQECHFGASPLRDALRNLTMLAR